MKINSFGFFVCCGLFVWQIGSADQGQNHKTESTQSPKSNTMPHGTAPAWGELVAPVKAKSPLEKDELIWVVLRASEKFEADDREWLERIRNYVTTLPSYAAQKKAMNELHTKMAELQASKTPKPVMPAKPTDPEKMLAWSNELNAWVVARTDWDAKQDETIAALRAIDKKIKRIEAQTPVNLLKELSQKMSEVELVDNKKLSPDEWADKLWSIFSRMGAH